MTPTPEPDEVPLPEPTVWPIGGRGYTSEQARAYADARAAHAVQQERARVAREGTCRGGLHCKMLNTVYEEYDGPEPEFLD